MEVTNNQWAMYKNLIDNVAGSFNQDTLQWGTLEFAKDLYGEHVERAHQFTTLEVLIGYNTFRTWPITKHTDAGELDDQNMMVMLNRQYLFNNGWLTPEGYFNFSPSEDIFVHKGITYKADGDTLSSQAGADPLHIHLVLVRQEKITGV